MTIGLAALSGWIDPVTNIRYPVVHIAADRMITSGEREYEMRDQTKTFWPLWPASNVAILIAGRIDDLLAICQSTQLEAVSKSITQVSGIASLFSKHYHAYRTRTVERTVLSPYNLDLDSYLSRQKEFELQFRNRIEDAMNSEDMDPGEAIIAGVDDLGGHLFKVEPPGYERPCDSTGFVAIGTGGEHAELAFIASQYTSNRPWLEAMAIAYFAKKRAEMAAGVGPNTDLYYIMRTGGRYFAPNDAFPNALQEKYNMLLEVEELAILDAAGAMNEMFAKEQNTAQSQPQAQPQTIERDDDTKAENESQEGA